MMSLECVTKRRSSWACIGNPNPEQESSKGTHAQETSANQRMMSLERVECDHHATGRGPIKVAAWQCASHDLKVPHWKNE